VDESSLVVAQKPLFCPGRMLTHHLIFEAGAETPTSRAARGSRAFAGGFSVVVSSP